MECLERNNLKLQGPKFQREQKGEFLIIKEFPEQKKKKRNISIAVKEAMKNVLHEHVCKTCGTSFKSNAARSHYCDKCREQAKENWKRN